MKLTPLQQKQLKRYEDQARQWHQGMLKQQIAAGNPDALFTQELERLISAHGKEALQLKEERQQKVNEMLGNIDAQQMINALSDSMYGKKVNK